MIVTKETSPLMKKTSKFWDISKAWNNQKPEGDYTIGSSLQRLSSIVNLSSNHIPLQFQAHNLRERIILAKRCRKTKDRGNVVLLSARRLPASGSSGSQVSNKKVG